MAILQHYYTSYTNKETGSAGFQVKAMSPGIPSNTQTIIARQIAYRIPPTLNEHALETHPIALRYSYQGPHESIFLCSQSNGNDENGRPGNFFAHTLVMEPTLFSSIPPILYWKSPFWRTRDPESRSSIDSLPTMDTLEEEQILDHESVWNFLAQRNRKDLLYKLMCAVVHSDKTQRRIVILDTTDNVVWWIVAVTLFLPPAYRSLLTFATYHHDPYQAQFLITGTTPDSSFRDSAEEHLSFFVLNAITSVTSMVEPSVYAKMVAESVHPDLYEANLVPLFNASYGQRLKPTVIDEQLDLLVLYANILTGQREGPLTEQEIQAVHVALTTLDQHEMKQADIDELRKLRPILWAAYTDQEEINLLIECDRVVALLRNQKALPTEEIVEERLCYFTEQLIRGANSENVLASFEKLKQNYGEANVTKILNRQSYLHELQQLLVRTPSMPAMQDIWYYLGVLIKPGEASQRLLVVSLSIVDDLLRKGRLEEEQAMLQSMWQAMKGSEQDWLRLAAAHHKDISEGVLEAFYYYLASTRHLAQRTVYRDVISGVRPGVTKYEIQRDIERAGPQQALSILEAWIHYGNTMRYNRPGLVEYALKKLKKISSPEQWSNFAPGILMNDIFAPLPEQLERELVGHVLSQASLSQFSDSSLPLYKKYENYEGIADDIKIKIAAILAITTGKLDEQLAQRLYQYTKTLSLQEYEEAVARCIPEFFRHPFTHETHHNVIAAFLTWKYGYTNAHCFWSMYWQAFTDMLLEPAAVGLAVDFLDFWFTTAPEQFEQFYVVQYFLFTLPTMISSSQKQRGFQEALQRLNGAASHHPWHSSVQELFAERKNVLAVLGQNMFSQLQKRLVVSNDVKEVQEVQTREQQVFETKMTKLFRGENALNYHYRLAEFYNAYSHKQFWTAYWKQFIELFVSQYTDFTLVLLKFWFDDSFTTLRDAPYIAQEFFLGLSEALEEAKKEKGFREAVRSIQEKAMRQKQEYSYFYQLIKPYLL